MQATANSMTKRALFLLGVHSPGQSMSDADRENGLDTLREMFDSFKAERLLIYNIVRVLYTVPVGKGLPNDPITIGDGGNIDRDWPWYVDRASCISNTNPAQPLELPIAVLMSPGDYQQMIPVKDVQSSLFQALYYEKSYPLGQIFLYPILNVSNVQLVLYLPTPMIGFTDDATPYDFPPGYVEGLTYVLAMRLAPSYGEEPMETVEKGAATFMARMQRANPNMDVLKVDTAIRAYKGGFYNYRSDTFNG